MSSAGSRQTPLIRCDLDAALERRTLPDRAPRSARRISAGPWLIVGVFTALVIIPAVIPLHPNRIDLDAILLPPSRAHPLGTDENGRDVLARLLVGAWATLGIGIGGAAVAVVVGALVGCLAGYTGKAIDAAMMRCVDVALAFPSLFAILLFTAFITPGPVQLVLLIGLTGWMPVSRLIRGNVRELRNAPYIEAARASGVSPPRMLFRHILPNTRSVLFVAALVQLSRAILAEATISFLGLGIQLPTATWGNMLTGAQNYLYTAPWLAIFPGLAITFSLLGIYHLGMERTVAPWSGHR